MGLIRNFFERRYKQKLTKKFYLHLAKRAEQLKKERMSKDTQHKIEMGWLYSPYSKGWAREFDGLELRELAKAEIAQICETYRSDIIQKTPWSIIQTDPQQKSFLNNYNPYQRESLFKNNMDRLFKQTKAQALEPLTNEATDFLNHNNVDNISLGESLGSMVFDLDEVGNSVWVFSFDENGLEPLTKGGKTYDVVKLDSKNQPILKPDSYKIHNPLQFNISTDEYGIMCGLYHYPNIGYGLNGIKEDQYFREQEVIWLTSGRRTDRLYGFATVEKAKKRLNLANLTVDQEIEYFLEGCVSPGILSFEGWEASEVDMFKDYWQNEVKGQPGSLAFSQGKTNYTQLTHSYKDLQFLERQLWYIKTSVAQWGLNDSVLGLMPETTNLATAIQEAMNAKERSIGTTLSLIEQGINQQWLWRYYSPKLSFVFHPVMSVEERQVLSDLLTNEIKTGMITVNEGRLETGKPEIPGADVLRDPAFDQLPEIRRGFLMDKMGRDGFLTIDEVRARVDPNLKDLPKGIGNVLKQSKQPLDDPDIPLDKPLE